MMEYKTHMHVICGFERIVVVRIHALAIARSPAARAADPSIQRITIAANDDGAAGAVGDDRARFASVPVRHAKAAR